MTPSRIPFYWRSANFFKEESAGFVYSVKNQWPPSKLPLKTCVPVQDSGKTSKEQIIPHDASDGKKTFSLYRRNWKLLRLVSKLGSPNPCRTQFSELSQQTAFTHQLQFFIHSTQRQYALRFECIFKVIGVNEHTRICSSSIKQFLLFTLLLSYLKVPADFMMDASGLFHQTVFQARSGL